MNIDQLVNLFGLLDAVLIVGIIFIWREWRRAEREVVELLKEQVEVRSQMITRYAAFETVLTELTKFLKD